MKKEMIDGLPSKVLGLQIDMLEKLRSGKILVSELEKFLKRQDPFKNDEGVIGEWREFYRKNFGIELEKEIKIPEKKEGFDRLIIVVKGLTNNTVYDTCAKHFPCWRYAEDLNKAVPTSERDPKNGTYAIWVRDVIEADEVHKSKSAEMIKKEGLKTETLLERMLHELVYFLETKGHLDIQNVTLCSGSRDSDGGVPDAGWCGDGFGVCWGSTDNSYEGLRSREVIS